MTNLIICIALSAQAVVGSIQSTTSSTTPRSTNALAGIMERRISLDVTNVPLAKVLDEIAKQGKIEIGYIPDVVQRVPRVTIIETNITVNKALQYALRNTQLTIEVFEGKLAVIERARVSRSVKRGAISGKVTNTRTGKGISGASVIVGSDTRGVTTGEDGSYRVVDVAAGTHTVTVRLVGYAKQSRQITVGEGGAATVDFKLEPSASILDQVVVTGSVVATELKAIPNAITVVTAKQLEERGITRIDQLFRGDIPGMFAQNSGSGSLLDEVTMFSRGATALSTSSAGVGGSTGALTNPIKTYIDGVEVADSKYLSQIDPKSIERIEILTGPQASTIYGSNAINGVMQIFTKRGAASRPQLTLNLLTGWVENNFSSAKTPQHDHSAQLSGIEGKLSYSVGGSWDFIGAWTPAKQSTRTSGFGGATLEIPTIFGHVTADMTARRGVTQNRQRGSAEQIVTGYRQTGWYTNVSSSGLSTPGMYTQIGQTFGLTLRYIPVDWWTHEIGLGNDISNRERRVIARGYLSVSDTTLLLQQNYMNRRSMRYTTSARIPMTSAMHATVVAGADGWQGMTSSTIVRPQVLNGSLSGTTSISRQPGHNTGGFLQTQLGIKDQLYITYGIRAEWNPNYGVTAQPNYAPRYGIAYTQDLGYVTAKLRGSYGRSTRPPQIKLKAEQTIADYYMNTFGLSLSSEILQYYPMFNQTLSNPNLGPEHQRGGEGGLELYFGSRGSLIVTRYNQTVDELIAQPIADSVRTLVPCPQPNSVCFANSRDVDGYGYYRQFQYLNIGSIRNQGWELQGNLNIGPVATHGTYSWTKSRTIGVNDEYSTQFTNQPQYKVGAMFQYLPEHTWALGVMYAQTATMVGLNVTGTGRVMKLQDDFFLLNFDSNIRLPQNRLNVSAPSSAYINSNRGYVLADLTASRRFMSRMEGVLQIQNLMDYYMNDYWALYASMGRQIKVGARIR